MDPVITTVASVLATIATVFGGILYLDRKMEKLRTDLTQDNKDLRDELGGEISAGRAETRSEIKDVQTELGGNIKDVHTELGGEISAGRAESRSEFKEVRTELGDKIDSVNNGLGDKIDSVNNGLGSEIKEVRDASYSAHTAIRQDLADIKIQQAAHTERLKCIESPLDVNRSDD